MRAPLPLDPALREALAARRDALVAAWRERVLASYPEEALRLLRRSPDPFSNPVVHRLHEATAAIVDLLILPVAAPGDLATALDPLMRVKAVQSQSASEAAGSVLLLKRAAADVLGDACSPRDRAAIDEACDALMLAAFDAYMRCRDELHAIRLRDVRRRVAVVLERFAGTATEEAAADDGTRVPLG